jgi:hypothetical protein
MPARINSVLLSLSRSLFATSAMALRIGQRVTIDRWNGPASGTVVDSHSTTGESKVHLDGREDHEDQWHYDKDIHLGAAAAEPAAGTPSVQPTTPRAQPQRSAVNGQRTFNVGQRVEYVNNDKWLKAIITKVASDDDIATFGPYHVYHVHLLGYNAFEDAWVSDYGDFRAQVRPAGSGATEPVPGGEADDDVLRAMRGDVRAASAEPATAATSAQPASGGGVPAKRYHCVLFVSDHLVDAAPLTITGNSTYTDREGKRGIYSFSSASSTLAFHGGNYDGQRAEYETNGGRPPLHILRPSGRRVIDCDERAVEDDR